MIRLASLMVGCLAFGGLLFSVGVAGTPPQQPPQPPPPKSVKFLFGDVSDVSGTTNFVVVTSVPAVIKKARAELKLSPKTRKGHISGPIAEGDGGHNLRWHWHFKSDQWQFVEATIEQCDGRAADVEKNLDYWLNTVGRFCPWNARVLTELTE
jgi:hypothetical protein